MTDFTLQARLCDDDGIVRRGAMHHGVDYECTGSAHFAGDHIKCISPAHRRAQYCDDCGRLLGIGCDCGLTFKEKMGDRSFRMGDWAPSKPSKWQPPKGGRGE